jgi:hypothetical protein
MLLASPARASRTIGANCSAVSEIFSGMALLTPREVNSQAVSVVGFVPPRWAFVPPQRFKWQAPAMRLRYACSGLFSFYSFPVALARVSPPFTRKLTEVIVASHPNLALASLAILTSSGPGSKSTAGTTLRASISSAARLHNRRARGTPPTVPLRGGVPFSTAGTARRNFP